MVYDDVSGKGIRKRYLPDPNPSKVEMKKNSSLKELYSNAHELYFKEIDVDEYRLGDSSGIPVSLIDENSWTFSLYFRKNNLQPSRHKIYVIALLKAVSL